jgi:serine/threonine-protein kinase
MTVRLLGASLFAAVMAVSCSRELVVGDGEKPGLLFPKSAPFYREVSADPVDTEWPRIAAGLDARGGWGGAGRFSMGFDFHVMHAAATVTPRAFTPTADYPTPDCDTDPVPLPDGGRVEGRPDYSCVGGGCRLLVVQGTNLFEVYNASVAGGSATGTPFSGGCLANWDLTRNYWRPAAAPAYARGDQCTSADAAGLPVAALLFSADEVKAGSIEHALRFSLPTNRLRQGEYVRPATHGGGRIGTPAVDQIPFGARLRLRASFDPSSLASAGARVVARALQKYGMYLSEEGNIVLMGQSDALTTAKWAGLLAPADLAVLKVSDFAMIDAGPRIPTSPVCVRNRP